MALIEEALEVAAPAPMVLGVGLALSAPMLLRALRPLAKLLVRGGLYVADSAKALYSEAIQPETDGRADASQAPTPARPAGRERPTAGRRRRTRRVSE